MKQIIKPFIAVSTTRLGKNSDDSAFKALSSSLTEFKMGQGVRP